MRILVVEDTRDTAMILSKLIIICGHDCRVAFDGFEALNVAREYGPEMVLMDINMPGIDGYETSRRLRQDVGLLEAPIYALSAYYPEPTKEEQAGMNGHYMKPLTMPALKKLLDC